MDDEIQAAVEDFEEALLQEGPSEATRTLQSYTVELHGATIEALAPFVRIYSAYIARLLERKGAIDWEECAELKNILSNLLQASPALVSELQSCWQSVLGSILLNNSHASLEEQLARVRGVQNWLHEAIQGTSVLLKSNASPCDDYTRRSLIQSTMYSFALFSYDGTIERELEKLFEATLADLSTQRATLLQLLPIMQGAFEAAIDTVQTAAAVHAVSQLTKEDRDRYYVRCWSYLSALRRILPQAGDPWWGCFALTIHQLAAALKQHHGSHPALTAVCRLMCHSESANMLLQFLRASPTCTEKGAKGVKAVFQTAQTLLQDHPGALIAACCELLAPDTNAVLGTRIDALQSKCRK